MSAKQTNVAKAERRRERRRLNRDKKRLENTSTINKEIVVVPQRVLSRVPKARKRGKGAKIQNGGAKSYVPSLRSEDAPENTYLRMLIDPLGADPDSYPDEFDGLSSTFKGIVGLDVPYEAADLTSDGVTWSAGRYHTTVVPDIKYPLRFLGANSSAISLIGEIDGNSPSGGIMPVRSIDSTATEVLAEDDDKLIMANGVTYNFFAPLAITSGTPGQISTTFPETVSMFHGRDAGGAEFFGYPFDASGSTVVRITFEVHVTGGANNLNAVTVSPSGQSANTSLAVTVPGTYSLSIATANHKTCVVPPGVGVRFSHDGSSAMELGSITVRFLTSTGKKIVWLARPIPDVEIASMLYTKYRVVSMCGLLSFKGAEINNGGKVAAYLFRGGQAPSIKDLITYETLIQTTGAFDGPTKNGAYGYWQPFDTKAMQFRSLNKDLFQFPYLVFSGLYTGSGTGSLVLGNFRMKVGINYETITTAQVVPQRNSRLDLTGERKRAALYMREMPPVMENPLHLGAIADVLRDVIRGTASVASRAWQLYNKGKNSPIATTALPLVGTALSLLR